MIDVHNHVLPGIDDGAVDLEETREAIQVMMSQGVRTLVTTPHLDGTLTTRAAALEECLAEVDAAWLQVNGLVAEEFPDLRLERGVELKLDTPGADLSDPRLRLAGGSYVLVEFPGLSVPPNSPNSLQVLKAKGWRPIVAHPERYVGLVPGTELFEEWRRAGALLQVNCGSLLGRYGDQARTVAWQLLREGKADVLASDYHARGRCPISGAREKLVASGGGEQAELLLVTNPARIVGDQSPEPVPPLVPPGGSVWRRLFRFGE
jgi:protein-tyrosine phosphatase